MSDTENIVFKKGLGNLPLPNVENGSVLIETDSGRMYIDDNDVRTQISRKISIGDELPMEEVKEGDIFLKNGADNGEEDMFNLLYPIVNEHVNADNPHGITREYLGAAKEGYVYKSINDVDTEADLENALNAELATMSGNTVRFLVISPKTSNYLFGGCGTLCELYCRTKDYGTAKFTWYSDYKTPNIAYKNIYGGVWDPLAWLNPPMALGAEYRTTERWNGSPVYTKLLDGGAAVNKQLIYLPETVYLKRACAMIGNNAIPYDDGNDYAKLAIGGSSFMIICSDVFIGQQLYIQYWYTK